MTDEKPPGPAVSREEFEELRAAQIAQSMVLRSLIDELTRRGAMDEAGIARIRADVNGVANAVTASGDSQMQVSGDRLRQRAAAFLDLLGSFRAAP